MNFGHRLPPMVEPYVFPASMIQVRAIGNSSSLGSSIRMHQLIHMAS